MGREEDEGRRCTSRNEFEYGADVRHGDAQLTELEKKSKVCSGIKDDITQPHTNKAVIG